MLIMKLKKERSKDAIADIVGTVLMLGMAVSLIAMLYITVLSYPFTHPGAEQLIQEMQHVGRGNA